MNSVVIQLAVNLVGIGHGIRNEVWCMMIYVRDTGQLCCSQTMAPAPIVPTWPGFLGGQSCGKRTRKQEQMSIGGSILSPNHSSNLRCSLMSTSTFATITDAIQRRANTEPPLRLLVLQTPGSKQSPWGFSSHTSAAVTGSPIQQNGWGFGWFWGSIPSYEYLVMQISYSTNPLSNQVVSAVPCIWWFPRNNPTNKKPSAHSFDTLTCATWKRVNCLQCTQSHATWLLKQTCLYIHNMMAQHRYHEMCCLCFLI